MKIVGMYFIFKKNKSYKVNLIQIFGISVFCILLFGCSKNNKSASNDLKIKSNISIDTISDIKFQYKTYDFGKFLSKEKVFVSCNFEFINEMENPLIIYKADVTCGCISTEIPTHPIKKGDAGTIKVTVDTRKVSGNFSKAIFVKSNSQKEDVILLRVKGAIK